MDLHYIMKKHFFATGYECKAHEMFEKLRKKMFLFMTFFLEFIINLINIKKSAN